MEEKHKVIGIIGLIALRKSELYYRIVNEISKKRQISQEDKEKIKRYVAEMENERFLSKEEKKNKKINSELKLENIEINIDEVIKEIMF